MLKTALVSCLLAAVPMFALAGDNNRVDLLQSATGNLGNTLTVDQSGADNSLVAGALGSENPLVLTPAQQVGDGNEAMLTLTGDGARMFLQQGQSIDNPGIGNEAIAVIAGRTGLGVIQQLGSDNFASLNVTSQDATLPSDGSIFQDGQGNSGTLTVEGLNVSGTLRQIGNDNVNTLAVTGENTSVEFIQEGTGLVNNGLGDFAAVPGISVFSNAGSVTITQTNF